MSHYSDLRKRVIFSVGSQPLIRIISFNLAVYFSLTTGYLETKPALTSSSLFQIGADRGIMFLDLLPLLLLSIVFQQKCVSTRSCV